MLQAVLGLGLAVLSFFLIPPVTALFAGLYLDHIAGLVEERHYPADPPGRELPIGRAIITGLQFGLLVLVVPSRFATRRVSRETSTPPLAVRRCGSLGP